MGAVRRWRFPAVVSQRATRCEWPGRRAFAPTLVAALGILLAGCSGGSPAADREVGPDAPSVGECRILTADDIDAATNETPTVPCSTPHTGVTIHVGAFPSWKITSSNLSSGALGDQALTQCTAAWRQTVGGDATAQHTTVANLAYYLPDSDALAAGARWFRCDLVIGGRDGMQLTDLPATTEDLLAAPVPDSLRACRTTPDFVDGRQVACDHPHVLRAIGVAALPDRADYPGDVALRRASAQGCSGVVRRWLHGRVGAGTAFQWPDETAWTLLDDRSATCWAVTVD